MEQNRDVYAVPGSIFSEQSVGVHQHTGWSKMYYKCSRIIEDYVNCKPLRGEQSGIKS